MCRRILDVAVESTRADVRAEAILILCPFFLSIHIVVDEKRQFEDSAVLEPRVKRQIERASSCKSRVLLRSSLVYLAARLNVHDLAQCPDSGVLWDD
jgi:hypothetical protein